MNKFFKTAMTYATVTPESASNGDFAETGWIREFPKDLDTDLIGALNELKSVSIESVSDDGGNSVDVYCHGFTSDYSTGEETTECLHIEAKNRRQLEKLFIVAGMKLKGGK